MPCSYHFSGNTVLVCVFEGLYSLDETRAVFMAGLDDDRAAGGVEILLDITGSASVKTPDDFRRIVGEIVRHDNFRRHIAVVADKDDPLRYGLARQFATLTSMDGVPMAVCDSISAALSWLLGRSSDEDAE